MSVSSSAVVWIFLFVAIWYIMIRKDDRGRNYGLLGAFALLANALAGFIVIGDDITVWIATFLIIIYNIRIITSYELFRAGGGEPS